jgi:hypothetical protein
MSLRRSGCTPPQSIHKHCVVNYMLQRKHSERNEAYIDCKAAVRLRRNHNASGMQVTYTRKMQLDRF